MLENALADLMISELRKDEMPANEDS